MPTYDDEITLVPKTAATITIEPKGVSPVQTIVPKPYLTPASLAIVTEDDSEILMENGVTLLVEGTL